MPISAFLSVDSLMVTVALVTLGMGSEQAYRMCGAFMVCDGLATLAGLSIHGSFGPVLLCAYLVFVLVLTARSPSQIALRDPALFSLDNLVSGMASKPGLTTHIWHDSVDAAVTSGLFALLGVAVATALRRSAPRGF